MSRFIGEPSAYAPRKVRRLSAALRAILFGVAAGALVLSAGCDQVKGTLEKAGIQLPSLPPATNPNPDPAPAPASNGDEAPVVVPPSETPTTPPAETPAPSAGETPSPEAPPATSEGTNPPAVEPTPNPAPTPPVEPAPQPPVVEPTPTPAPVPTPTPEPTPVPTPDPTPTPAPVTPPTTTPSVPPTPAGVVTSLFKDAGTFLYRAVGSLKEGSGEGVKDETIYAPNIAFPIKDAPTFLNSQVYGAGGMNGPAGSECAESNYSYPWQDNFCEKRPGANRASYNCPSKAIHQGQDIRAGDSATCTKVKKLSPADRKAVEVVAVEDGIIQYIGSFTVDLRAGGRIYRYLHLNMKALKVERGSTVKKGDVIGYLSNDFGTDSAGKPVATTLHLHFEIKQNIDGVGWTWVSPYMSLVEAYKKMHPTGALAK